MFKEIKYPFVHGQSAAHISGRNETSWGSLKDGVLTSGHNELSPHEPENPPSRYL